MWKFWKLFLNFQNGLCPPCLCDLNNKKVHYRSLRSADDHSLVILLFKLCTVDGRSFCSGTRRLRNDLVLSFCDGSEILADDVLLFALMLSPLTTAVSRLMPYLFCKLFLWSGMSVILRTKCSFGLCVRYRKLSSLKMPTVSVTASRYTQRNNFWHSVYCVAHVISCGGGPSLLLLSATWHALSCAVLCVTFLAIRQRIVTGKSLRRLLLRHGTQCAWRLL